MVNNGNLEKNKKIFFIGRLEKEKGVEYLIGIIKNSILQNKSLEYHIFGDGSYFSYFSYLGEKYPNFVKLYGKLDRKKLFDKIKNNADILLMPSEFLETFGLSALEVLQFGVPVIGFRKGGLIDFIPENLAIDEKNVVESFFEIIDNNFNCKNFQKNNFPIVDISEFNYQNWVKNLEELTKGFEKILLVHDYEDKIGGAELYVEKLGKELEKIGKTVQIFSYKGKLTSKIRKKLFIKSLYSSENYHLLSKKINDFSPDLIWSNTILRYIGVGGMRAIKQSKIPHFLTHHDLGLFSSQPSKIKNLNNIPSSINFGSWLAKSNNLISLIKTIIKWIIVFRIWKSIPNHTIHIFPSSFMLEIGKNWNLEQTKVFAHTIFK